MLNMAELKTHTAPNPPFIKMFPLLALYDVTKWGQS